MDERDKDDIQDVMANAIDDLRQYAEYADRMFDPLAHAPRTP
jgi:hypothetical protein